MIAPSVQIERGWAAEAIQHGPVGVKSLDPSEREIVSTTGQRRQLIPVEHAPAADLLFWIVTYQSLRGLSGILHRLCQGRPVFVILDEIHHASSANEGSWGDYVTYSLQDAQLVLCTSATPSRTDGQRIAWLRYDAEGFAMADYELEWRRAIRDGLIVAAEFAGIDSKSNWRRITADDEVADSALISDERQGGMALGVAIQSTEFQDTLIEAGRKSLNYKRGYQYANATGLILADSQHMADQIARRLNTQRPGSAVVATSDKADAHRTIDDFRNRKVAADWLVAVGMASEGCDIPHVKVIVWLNRIRTTNDFIQRVGRGVRSVGADVTLTVVLPDHPELHRMAVELLDLQGPPLDEREMEERGIADREASTIIADGVEDVHPTWYTKEDTSRQVDDEAVRVAEQSAQPIDVVQEVLLAHRNLRAPKRPRRARTMSITIARRSSFARPV